MKNLKMETTRCFWKKRLTLCLFFNILLCCPFSYSAVESPELKTELLEFRKNVHIEEEGPAGAEAAPKRLEVDSKHLVGLKEKTQGKVRRKKQRQGAFQEYLIPGLQHKNRWDELAREGEEKSSEKADDKQKGDLLSQVLKESSEEESLKNQNSESLSIPANSEQIETQVEPQILPGPESEPSAGPLAASIPQKEEDTIVVPNGLLDPPTPPAVPSVLDSPEVKKEEEKEIEQDKTDLQAPETAFELQNIYKVWRVYDGDSLRLQGDQRVVLIGVDSPENFMNRKMFNESRRTKQTLASLKAAGKKAVERTKALAEGKWVRLEFDVEKEDQFGRMLAYVFLQDGTFLNAELIRSGYARARASEPNVKFSDLFFALEREARENERGFWKKNKAQASSV